MKNYKLDGKYIPDTKAVVLEKNKHGTIRVNGRTKRELNKEMRQKYSKEELAAMNKLVDRSISKLAAAK